MGSGLGSALAGEDDDEAGATAKLEGEARKAGLTYAWEYFKYHAQQRQASFRFYLIIVAGILAVAFQKESQLPREVAGVSLCVASLLFWRLDRRNNRLVGLAEAALLIEEARLASETGTSQLRILEGARDRLYSWRIMRPITTYTQINRVIFLLVGIAGFMLCFPDSVEWAASIKDSVLHGVGWLRGQAVGKLGACS